MSKKKQNEEKISIDQLARDAKKTALIGKFNLRFECKRIKGKWTTREECVQRYRDGQFPCASECAKVVLWAKEDNQQTKKGDKAMAETMVCNICKKEKPIEQFRVSEFTGKRVSTCDECERKYGLGPYKKGKEEEKASESPVKVISTDSGEISTELSTDLSTGRDEKRKVRRRTRVDVEFNYCPGLLDRLRERAKANFRTFSAQVCWELMQAEKALQERD